MQDLQPVAVLPYLSRSGTAGRRRTHTGFNFVFAATRWQGQVCIAEPATCDLLCWVPPTRLPNPYPGWLDELLTLNQQQGWYAELNTAGNTSEPG